MSQERKSPRVLLEVENKTDDTIRIELHPLKSKCKPNGPKSTLSPGQKQLIFMKAHELIESDWEVNCMFFAVAPASIAGTKSDDTIKLTPVFVKSDGQFKCVLHLVAGPVDYPGEELEYMFEFPTYKLVHAQKYWIC